MIERIDIPIPETIFEDDIGILGGYEGKTGLSISLSVYFKENNETNIINFPKSAIPLVIKWLEGWNEQK